MPSQQTPTEPPLVDTAFLEQHLDDPTVRPIEVDVDTTLYQKGHVPGAVGWDWTTELQHPIRRDIAERDTVLQLLADAGVDDDTTLVLYGDHDNWFAAYAFWLLLYHGFDGDRLRLLDGGRRAWNAAGGELTDAVPTSDPATPTLGEPRHELRALSDDVLAVARAPTPGPLVDVRSPEEFTGEIVAPPGLDETAQRPGHIPGAANVPWVNAVADDGTFRSREELEQLYGQAGIGPDQETIVYCRIGERSSHSWFAITQILGWSARNYDGSWTEYGNLIDVPIEAPARG